MRKRIVLGFAGALIMCVLGFGDGVLAAEELVGPIYPVPRFGSFYSLAHTNWPPMPVPPKLFTNAVYAIVGWTNHYVFNDLDDPDHTGGLSRSEMEEESGGDEPGPLNFGSYGTNLFIMIGLTNNGQAWLSLSNTHSGTYYQVLSRPDVSSPPWQYGQIRQASSSLTPFDNVSVLESEKRFYRGVGGDTVVSIFPHPDYNLAVEPSAPTNAAQVGKFLITINPTLGATRTIVYQISGQATNGTDYTNINSSVNIGAGLSSVEVPIGPKYNSLPGFDRTVTLSLVLTNGYLVSPTSAVATVKIYDPRPSQMAVAILDSGWTRFNRLSNTNWNYFVLPEAVKEALRSDGTPYAVFSDLDIANGALMTTNGLPKYPILIDLAGESMRDDEIAPLTNYLAAGGFIMAGSSAFTRGTNGAPRPNFALSAQMGVGCNPSAVFWYDNTNFTKQVDHPLLRDIPSGPLHWRMPTGPDEISWGSCLSHSLYCGGGGYDGGHQIWVVTNSTAQVLAVEDGNYPYVTVNQYGGGYLIYDAALQPLIGHGGFAPGMYAYMIFRRAIEWAFQAAQRPVVRLSPWQYTNDAAFMIRHDLENYTDEAAALADSAYIENTNGAKGDYYFCTGAGTNHPTIPFSAVLSSFQTAAGFGATIGPHNGGLPNPRATAGTNSCCYMDPQTYEYWHWGPDESLDVMGGKDYSSNSLAISFAQIESWVTNQPTMPRVWVAPYFNATRDDSCEIQEALGVKITGDQKLGPFPAFTISTRKDGKRYDLLSQPTSDWFVGAYNAQSLDPWHEGVHDTNTLRAGVDFYYTNGFLINFYSHGLSSGDDGPKPYPLTAGHLVPEYIRYSLRTQRPKLWSANARDVYAWWAKRNTAQVSASYSTNGTHSVATIGVDKLRPFKADGVAASQKYSHLKVVVLFLFRVKFFHNVVTRH